MIIQQWIQYLNKIINDDKQNVRKKYKVKLDDEIQYWFQKQGQAQVEPHKLNKMQDKTTKNKGLVWEDKLLAKIKSKKKDLAEGNPKGLLRTLIKQNQKLNSIIKQQMKRKLRTDRQSNSKKFQKKNQPLPTSYLYKLVAFGVVLYFISNITDLYNDWNKVQQMQNININELIDAINRNQIEEIWLELIQYSDFDMNSSPFRQNYICVKSTDNKLYRCFSNTQLVTKLTGIVLQYNTNSNLTGNKQIVINYQNKFQLHNSATHLLNLILKASLIFFIYRSLKAAGTSGKKKPGDIFKIGNKKKKTYQVVIPSKTTFKDVVGMHKAKQQIMEFIDFIKKPKKYKKLGARIPKGALLTGPPGTGKTLIVKACAGEASVRFFSISGSQFVEMYVGVGAQRVRELFAEAKAAAPSIIFIDEIDAIGKKRSSRAGGNQERDNTLNQLLVQMDGFQTNNNVIVFAATNQKQVLDSALTRPGRFDRLVEVELPDIEGRKEIFMVHLKPINLDKKFTQQEYARRMATLTPGFSGADIKNLCNEAAINAARNNHKTVTMIDFEMATERIIGGVERKSALITVQTKRVVAYHQCGHGLVSWLLEHSNPLLKLTIIPRSKGALGFAQYLPNENRIMSLNQMMDQICVFLGGRISQELFFDSVSTGAQDDLKKAYQIAKGIVTEAGMSQLGWLSYDETEYAKEYSEATSQAIDRQISKIIFQCTNKTRKLLKEKKKMIEELAEVLLEKETIDHIVIEKVWGQRPFKSSKQYEDYVKEKNILANEQTKQKLSTANADANIQQYKFQRHSHLL